MAADIGEVNAWVKQVPELPKLDAVKPIMLANNRWRCDHGWDIDLDDGSSFYIITNNLCLHGGIKNREGFGRVVENNIMVDNGLRSARLVDESGDIFRRNIVWTAYRPANMHRPPWGADMDFNLVQRIRRGDEHARDAVAAAKRTRRTFHRGRRAIH